MQAPDYEPDAELDNRRVLIIDDNEAIHQDFHKIIGLENRSEVLDDLEAELFGEAPSHEQLELDSAYQGEEGFRKVCAARAVGAPYAVAFVDVRMPPGIDGIETTARIMAADPDIGIVICSAYSDHRWSDVVAKLGPTDRVLILRKPFDSIEVRQLAHALRCRWKLARQASTTVEELEARVRGRTQELESAHTKILSEIEARERMEMELRVSHKLEAVGQLAAGIAHEINTPMQYIGDNVHFLSGAYEDVSGLIARYRSTFDALEPAPSPDVAAGVAEAEAEADLEYLTEHVPRAFEMALEGIGRVTEIVRSMKELSHPDQREKTPVDVNQAVRNALVVTRNEYKYVADVETELGDVPAILCYGGDISQVFLNVIVNAAHAVGDVVRGTGDRGRIAVRTREEQGQVVIEIEDTGGGIPEEVRHRVFDPFFTTKEVGRGTGQGLAISRAVVDRHGGTITIDTEMGRGTTFCVRLPLSEATCEERVA